MPLSVLRALSTEAGLKQYKSCFISYGEPDIRIARRLYESLSRKGVPCWLFQEDKTAGQRTWKEIGRRRRRAEKVIVLCSRQALRRDGLLKEIEEQIDEDPDKLIPISLDQGWKASSLFDVALEISSRSYWTETTANGMAGEIGA